MNLPSLTSGNFKNKKVFVRCDLDVPLKSNKIIDESRLVSSISTIEYLLVEGATVIVAGHMGRPEGKDESLSLEIVAKWFADEFPNASLEETSLNGFKAWKIKENFYLLENLRFFKEEEDNQKSFSERLAGIADYYVNEAFGSSHRDHASIVGVANILPHFAGFHLEKEIKILSSILLSPKRPMVVIIGGAKIETKLPLISKMHEFADFLLIGGEIASKREEIKGEGHAKLVIANLENENNDIDEFSLDEFIRIVKQASCVVWNGPMGNLEKGFSASTLNLAEEILSTTSYKVVGGGDTVGFLNEKKLADKFDFVSMGGGAMLEFLAGNELPGLEALMK